MENRFTASLGKLGASINDHHDNSAEVVIGDRLKNASDNNASDNIDDQYQNLFDVIGQGFCICEFLFDKNGEPQDYQFLKTNRLYSQISGLRDVEGKWAREIMPDLEELWFETYGEMVKTGRSVRIESHVAGLGKWFEVNAFPIADPNHPFKFGMLFTDISDRKKSEQNLKESESRYRLLADSIPQLVWISDAQGLNEYVNQQMVDYTGLGFDQLRRFNEEIIFHPDDWESTYAKWSVAIADQKLFENEYRLRSADGSYRWFIGRALPIKNEQGDATSWFGTATDINEQKQLEHLYTKLLEGIQERNEDLDQFSQIVAHDLKAPLRAIANLTQWLEDDLGNTIPLENQRQIHLMRERIGRMEDLIKGLLDYARIGRQNIPNTLVSVSQLVTEIIDSLAPLPTFTIQIMEPLPTFSTNRMLLGQVLRNLIDNAIKHHNRHDGTIIISVEEIPNFYKFTVSDDGVGVDPVQQKRIFDIFQTLETQDQPHCTGIGLAIVKKIIENQGGAIKLISELHKGSTFSFTWRKPSNPESG